MMQNLRIALTKGRLEKQTVGLFRALGFDVSRLENKGRKLILAIPGQGIDVVLAKAPDVITYVESGVCDMGIVGKDTIMEHGHSFYEVLDLGFGRCAFALATRKGEDFFSGYKHKKIASKMCIRDRDYHCLCRRGDEPDFRFSHHADHRRFLQGGGVDDGR